MTGKEEAVAAKQSEGGDRGGKVIMAFYFPLIIGGMLLVIAWGMSAAGFRRQEASRNKRSSPMSQILVTDDDPQTRLVVSDILNRKGYSVLMAKDGDEALKILENRSQELALLVTDFRMPGLPGTDLARRALALRPDIKVILMSGHRYEYIESHLNTAQNRFAYLEKPFTTHSLIHQVQGVLEL